MLKFRTDDLLGLGLSDENLARLREGKPILFSAADVGGLDGVKRVVIFWGKDEDEMQKTMRPYFEITPETEVRSGPGSF